MTIQEAILKQVRFLRECQEQRRLDALAASDAQNEYEKQEAIADRHLIDGITCDSNGEEITLSNDIARKAYIKNRTYEAKMVWNSAKAIAESSSSKVEVERSALSAIKDLREDAELDIKHLTKYDI